MPDSRGFQAIYSQLNPAQQQAVDTLEGPVMVIAGPGTGKTQVLAARIAHILLSTDTNPSSVLAMTFTESAAKNMRERLISMIGKTAYYVQIHTFHSFCTEVISSHPEYFPIDRDSQPLSDLERFELFQSIVDDLPLTVLKPLNTPYFYIRDLVKSISDLKREGIDLESFRQIVAAEQTLFDQEQESLSKAERARQEKKLLKNQELSLVYEAYQQRLRETLRYDFDDMIALVVAAFKDQPELLLEYQEKLHYFLVDEYQDTNSAQNAVVDLLASFWEEAANIFVVGDPNQAIYRFQGASLENVMGFTERYPQAQVITLTTGYRSPQTIYTAASDLIAENHSGEETAFSAELSQPLTSIKTNGLPLQLFKAPSQTLETIYIACKIKELLEQGVDPTEIAVLYRHNADALDISTTLDKWGIRYEIDGGNNVLEAEHICQLLSLFKVIESIKQGNEDGLLYEVLQYDWVGLDTLLVMKVARAASKAKLSLFELVSRGYDSFRQYHQTTEVTALEFAVLTDFVDKLTRWAARDAQLVFTAWFELVINESGFLPWVLQQENKIELLNAVNSSFREVKALTGSQRDFQLGQFLGVIATLEAHRLPIMLEDLNVTQDAVHLSTVHKAKGQEWQYVFLMRCIDRKWGNSRKRDLIPLPSGILKHTDISAKERNEDERRLFYVAITRAQTQITVTYPETIVTENRSKSALGSIFLEEIKDHLVLDESQTAQEVVDKADEHLAQMLEPATRQVSSNSEREFFRSLVKDYKLSVTALNTYLESPTRFRDECLLKVPTAKSPILSFGSAIHRSLEHWFKTWMRTNEKPSLESLLTAYEEALIKEPLLGDELDVRLAYGKEVLHSYFGRLESLEQQPLFIERMFGFGWSRTVLDDIPLTGRMDRVDWIDVGQKTVCVVDYKTGRPRTVGEIEATVASAQLSEREQSLPDSIRGKYKRQLLFYKILSELDASFIPTVTEAVFEFVEPDKQNGKIIQRRFSLPDTEVEDLKNLIREVAREIRELRFLE